MVRRAFSTIVFLTLIPSLARAGLDLTPWTSEYKSEGFVYRRVTLTGDGGKVTYCPPQGWTVRGDATALKLTPPRTDFGEALVMATPLKAPERFDADTVNALEQEVLGELPPGSQGIEVEKREANPVLMGPNPSYGFVVSYKTLGQVFRRSVIFVGTPGLRLTFRFTAPEPQFTALNTAFQTTLASWEWHDAQPAKGASPAGH